MARDYKSPDDRVAIGGVFGENGGIIIQDTNAKTGNFNCIYPLEDSVIAAATTPDFTGSLAGLTLLAGVPFYGRVTSITLTSGKVIAYTQIVRI
jgi:hypothetical protein